MKLKFWKKKQAPAAQNTMGMAEYFYQQHKDPAQGQNVLSLALNAYTCELEMSNDAGILARMARAYFLSGDLDKTQNTLDKVWHRVDVEKSDRRLALEVQALVYTRKGEFAQAKVCLKKALALATPWKAAKIYGGLMGISWSANNHKKGMADRFAGMGYGLMAFLTTPMTWNAKTSGPALALGTTQILNKFRDEDARLKALLELNQKYPGDEATLLALGTHYFNIEFFEEAEFWFKRLVDRHPSRDEGYRMLTNLYQMTLSYDELVDVLTRWQAIRPNSGEICLLLSQTLIQQPECFEEALRLARQATLILKDSHTLTNAYLHLAALYGAAHMIDAACTAYQAAIQLSPNRLDAYVHLGTMYYERHELKLAQTVFEQGLAISPNNGRLLCNLGYLAWMEGDVARAQRLYHKSIAIDPTYEIALNNLGVLYLDHIGDMDAAMALFEQTTQINPDYALSYFNIGRVHTFWGNTIEAAKAFQKARELNGNGSELDNADLTDRIQQLFEQPQNLSPMDM